MTGTAELVLDRRGPSLVARLNRPEARNALTPGLINGIGSAVAEAESDPAIRTLILTGTGDRAFCAGMDLRAFAGGASFADSGSRDKGPQDKEGADAYGRLGTPQRVADRRVRQRGRQGRRQSVHRETPAAMDRAVMRR